jgi:hypothetical protein
MLAWINTIFLKVFVQIISSTYLLFKSCILIGELTSFIYLTCYRCCCIFLMPYICMDQLMGHVFLLAMHHYTLQYKLSYNLQPVLQHILDYLLEISVMVFVIEIQTDPPVLYYFRMVVVVISYLDSSLCCCLKNTEIYRHTLNTTNNTSDIALDFV